MSAKTKDEDAIRVENVVNSGRFFDRGMDLDYEYAVYWDENNEKFDYYEFGHVEQHTFDFQEAPPEIQDRYRDMKARRSSLRDHRDALGDWVSKSHECPVCLNDTIYTHTVPDDLSDEDRVRFCPECECNTFYHQNWNGNWNHAVSGPGWDGKKYGAAIGGFLSPGSNAAKRAVETGDKELQAIHKFARQLRNLREQCGYDPNARIGPEDDDA